MSKVAIVMGSGSDLPVMEQAALALNELGVSYEISILSAHRTPVEMAQFAQTAADSDFSVIIAGAGGAAHLPGMIAAYTTLPVIGVPVPVGHLQGTDALLSIAQMPKGVPVATVAIGGAFNAGLLAGQIVGHGGQSKNSSVVSRLAAYKSGLQQKVVSSESKTSSGVSVRAWKP